MKHLEEYQLSFWERLEKRVEIESRQNVVLEILQDKFQEIADEIIDRIKAIEDSEILTRLTRQSAMIQSLDELALPEPA